MFKGVRLSKISQIRFFIQIVLKQIVRKTGCPKCRFAKVAGLRTLENGIVVPANLIVRAPKKKIFDKFMAEIHKMKDICRHMNINIYECSKSKKIAIDFA